MDRGILQDSRLYATNIVLESNDLSILAEIKNWRKLGENIEQDRQGK